MEAGTIQAMIDLTPLWAAGMSSTRTGARCAVLYQAHKTYKSYHPSYVVPSPFPDSFTDQRDLTWKFWI